MTPVPFISIYIDRVIGTVMLAVFVLVMLAILKSYGDEIAADFRAWWNRRKK